MVGNALEQWRIPNSVSQWHMPYILIWGNSLGLVIGGWLLNNDTSRISALGNDE